MAQQLTTAFSDFVLAVSCMCSVRQLTSYSASNRGVNFNYANAGFMLILLASSLGVLKFGLPSPPAMLVKCHRYSSYLASVVGVCCLAAEFYEQAQFHGYGQLHLYASLVVILLQLMLDAKAHNTIADFVAAAAVLSILLVCALHKIAFGCVGAVVLAVLAMVVGTGDGTTLGVPAVDLFHYGVVLVNYCFVQALTSK